jgi:hypothetical protein
LLKTAHLDPTLAINSLPCQQQRIIALRQLEPARILDQTSVCYTRSKRYLVLGSTNARLVRLRFPPCRTGRCGAFQARTDARHPLASSMPVYCKLPYLFPPPSTPLVFSPRDSATRHAYSVTGMLRYGHMAARLSLRAYEAIEASAPSFPGPWISVHGTRETLQPHVSGIFRVVDARLPYGL